MKINILSSGRFHVLARLWRLPIPNPKGEKIMQAMNKPYPLGVSGIIAAIVAIIISYFCCNFWGLTGAAIGTLTFKVIMATYVLPTSCRLIGLPKLKYR
jgi:Na+-driven multidrug efflux pump